MKKGLYIIALGLILFFVSRVITIFVMPPTAPITKGATIIMWKNDKLGFLATPISVCKSQPLNQTLCQGSVMAYYQDHDDQLIALPYIQPLHWLASL